MCVCVCAGNRLLGFIKLQKDNQINTSSGRADKRNVCKEAKIYFICVWCVRETLHGGKTTTTTLLLKPKKTYARGTHAYRTHNEPIAAVQSFYIYVVCTL